MSRGGFSVSVTAIALLATCLAAPARDTCQLSAAQRRTVLKTIEGEINKLSDEYVTYDIHSALTPHGNLHREVDRCWAYLRPMPTSAAKAVGLLPKDGELRLYMKPRSFQVENIVGYGY